MPYAISWHPPYAIFRFYGDIDVEDFLESNTEVYGDRRFDDLRYQVFDFREVSSVDIEDTGNLLDKIRLVAEMDKVAARSNPNIVVVTVATDSTIAALSSFYESEMMDSPWQSRFFATMEEAMTWVDSQCGIAARSVV